MSTLASSLPTLLDVNNATGPKGEYQTPIEMLAQSNEVIPDVYWETGNLPMGHKTTVQLSLPTVSSRQINQGVSSGKGTTDQFIDSCAVLESYSIIDSLVLAGQTDPTAYRMGQRAAWMEAYAQKFTDLLFNGNAITTPSDFTGILPRYNDTDGSTGSAIIDAGGSGSDNADMVLIGWGPRAVAGIIPSGIPAGLTVDDKGEIPWQTSTTAGAANSAFLAYIEWYRWVCGLSIRDWRWIVRIANIDLSDLTELKTTQSPYVLTTTPPANQTLLLNMMALAIQKVPRDRSNVRMAFYTNRTVQYGLQIMAMSRASSQITFEMVDGKPVTSFQGVPIRTVDKLGIATTRVTTSTVSI